jgi:hypothetical protein
MAVNVLSGFAMKVLAEVFAWRELSLDQATKRQAQRRVFRERSSSPLVACWQLRTP